MLWLSSMQGKYISQLGKGVAILDPQSLSIL